MQGLIVTILEVNGLMHPNISFTYGSFFPGCQSTPDPCNRDLLLPTHCPGTAAKQQLGPFTARKSPFHKCRSLLDTL